MVFTAPNQVHSLHTKKSKEDARGSVGIDAMQTIATSSLGLTLPPIVSHDFVSQRHEVNPAIALSLLSDIHAKVVVWQQQQRQIVRTMQMLYAQGPMVDGWLQSSLEPSIGPGTNGAASASATILRHGDADALMQYVNALEGMSEAAEDSPHRVSTDRSLRCLEPKSQYCLCRLNTDGTVRSQLCPPEQMATVSTAIARYQKFKQLTLQKRTIEAKLQNAVDSLTGLRTTIQQD